MTELEQEMMKELEDTRRRLEAWRRAALRAENMVTVMSALISATSAGGYGDTALREADTIREAVEAARQLDREAER